MQKKLHWQNLWLFNPRKLEILYALWECNDTMCGCDISRHIKMPKNLLSYHLKKLAQAGFVHPKKCGRTKQYIINDEQRPFLRDVFRLVGVTLS